MPSDPELTYGQSTDWQPERPRLRVFSLVVSWLAMGIALMVAAGVLLAGCGEKNASTASIGRPSSSSETTVSTGR